MSHPGFPNVGQVVKNNTSKCLEETNNGWNRFFNFEVKDQEQTKKQILRHGISLSPISIKKELHKAIYDSKTSVGDFFGNLKILDLFNQMKCKITGDEFTPQYWKVSVGIEQEPLLENKVSLSEKTDMHQKQRVQVYWGAVSKTERSTVKEAVKVLGRELGLTSSGLAKLNEETVNETVFETQDPVNHHIGTTRMAAFENEGVVDAQLEHFQVRNLFIAGSSVFPTSSIVNPTFTIFALSLRLGEEILNRLNKNTYYV